MSPQASARPAQAPSSAVGGQRERRRAEPDGERRGQRPGVGRREHEQHQRRPGAARAPSSRSATRAPRRRQASAASRGQQQPDAERQQDDGVAARAVIEPRLEIGDRLRVAVVRRADLAAVDLVGDLDPEVLEHGRGDVGGRSRPRRCGSRPRSGCRRAEPGDRRPAAAPARLPEPAANAISRSSGRGARRAARARASRIRITVRPGAAAAGAGRGSAIGATPVAIDADQRREAAVGLDRDRDPGVARGSRRAARGRSSPGRSSARSATRSQRPGGTRPSST